jgi:hypothetical protein
MSCTPAQCGRALEQWIGEGPPTRCSRSRHIPCGHQQLSGDRVTRLDAAPRATAWSVQKCSARHPRHLDCLMSAEP